MVGQAEMGRQGTALRPGPVVAVVVPRTPARVAWQAMAETPVAAEEEEEAAPLRAALVGLAIRA